MSTLAVNTITNAAGGNTAQINGMTPTADSLQGFRNRIINGDMRIDQRNNGASVAANDAVYPVDRFILGMTQSSKGTVQRSTVAPAGFTNSMLFTSSSAYSVLSSDIFAVRQMIEGFNFADLGFGTASASPVTVSFWVRSSLTGTFGGALANGSANRSYPFSYTISAANTWEYKTITIAGDTSGTWATDNSAGARLYFSFGMGSTYSGSAGSWAAADYRSATGATSVVGTSGATFYITGVQLEAGSVATPFERRPFGTELALCQRYFEKSYDMAVAPGTASSYAGALTVVPYSTANQYTTWIVHYKQNKRAQPTVTTYNPATGASGSCDNNGAVAASATSVGESGCTIRNTAAAVTGFFAYVQYTASAEL